MPVSGVTSYGIGHFLLRAGIAFAFLYPPFAALQDPIAWAAYFPSFIEALPLDLFLVLHAFGALEIIIGLWLLWGRNLKVPAILAAVLLLAIVGFNLNGFGVLFRDISIALGAFALAFLPEPRARNA